MYSQNKEKIFFYCLSPASPEQAAYQHSIICLAEGLQQLGIPFYGNINYWKTSVIEDSYLVCHHPEIRADDCQVAVISGRWFDYGHPFPENFFHPKRKYITIYLDDSDGLRTPSFRDEFRKFDYIFKCHYNRKIKYPNNFYPWAFGLSNRIIEATKDQPDFQERNQTLLYNFRVEHSLRDTVKTLLLKNDINKILPLDETIDSANPGSFCAEDYLQWSQSGRRHYRSYYQRLKSSVACAAFGGVFVPAFPQNPKHLMSRILNHILDGKMISKIDSRLRIIVQWDSWRFWESLGAGCATFHVDFDGNNFVLPVMPINWKHYIGIDLKNVKETIQRLIEDTQILAEVSTAGRRWAIEHYSPVPTATRFLKVIGKDHLIK
ncbi:hypothetical protein ACL6C3_03180 [Capilliphycus salinus ALCB114379]|uniref:hypothetical protein n=1 Tax=Capilliphycus salinus TaxID=2768948 RepID=UPI0039A40D60